MTDNNAERSHGIPIIGDDYPLSFSYLQSEIAKNDCRRKVQQVWWVIVGSEVEEGWRKVKSRLTHPVIVTLVCNRETCSASPANEVGFQMFSTNGGWRAVESSAKVEMQSRETALILTWPPRSSIGYRGQCWQLVL